MEGMVCFAYRASVARVSLNSKVCRWPEGLTARMSELDMAPVPVPDSSTWAPALFG